MVLDNIQIVEALLFASEGPISAKKIKEIVEDVTVPEIRKLIEGINERYEQIKSPLQVIEIAEGYQIVTRVEFANWIGKLVKAKNAQRLTKKALETLAIVAYKQPITKLEIESIRGVNSDTVVRTLIERNLITVVGREKAPGNPLLYGTTRFFMEYFGLEDLSHLPKLKEIDELLKNDEQFLESIDQVALEQLHPEALGLSSGQRHPTEAAGSEEGPEQNRNIRNPDDDADEGKTGAVSDDAAQ